MSDEMEDEVFQRMECIEFHGIKYDVELMVNTDVMTIQVENGETCEQWMGKFDASYIEELTHKTGNYKQFNIFCNMLDSALVQNTESVTLDLLTYEDLKVLREQKLGTNMQRRKHKTDNKLSTKRYLIMTYSVEFDQIHYPLPLSYNGIADPAILKTQLRELKIENHKLRRDALQGSSIQGIESDYERILLENKQLRKELKQCHDLLKGTENSNVSKELKVLQKLVQNLESDLLKERSKTTRLLNKKTKEYNNLLEEFEDIKANERNYRVRCKNLTSELSVLKKKLSPQVPPRNYRIKSDSAVKNTVNKNTNITKNRFIRQSKSPPRGRSRTRSASKNRERSLSGSSYGRTPSPGYKRFDPSAYIKEKKQKQKVIEAERRRRITPSSSSKRNHTPSYNHFTKPPSGGRTKSRNRSVSSNRGLSGGSDTDSLSRLRLRNATGNKRNKGKTKDAYREASDVSEDEYYRHTVSRKNKVTSHRPSPKKTYKIQDSEDEDGPTHSIGIAEIDARLEALQKFMQDNMD